MNMHPRLLFAPIGEISTLKQAHAAHQYISNKIAFDKFASVADLHIKPSSIRSKQNQIFKKRQEKEAEIENLFLHQFALQCLELLRIEDYCSIMCCLAWLERPEFISVHVLEAIHTEILMKRHSTPSRGPWTRVDFR